ncbi:MAG TPA: hypothetical protein VFG72_06390 [Marmoricola sp.]|nr:hypothetical protein [Marmoricola sp.]
MDFLDDVLVFLHFIGLAALFGGLFTQLRAERRLVNAAVLHGSLTQLVTGLLLVGLREAQEEPVPEQFHMKIGVKLLVTAVVVVLAFMNRKKDALADGVFFTLLGLTVLNIGVAVFWNVG